MSFSPISDVQTEIIPTITFTSLISTETTAMTWVVGPAMAFEDPDAIVQDIPVLVTSSIPILQSIVRENSRVNQPRPHTSAIVNSPPLPLVRPSLEHATSSIPVMNMPTNQVKALESISSLPSFSIETASVNPVLEPTPEAVAQGLSGGAIAGIVVGLACVIACAAGLFAFKKSRKISFRESMVQLVETPTLYASHLADKVLAMMSSQDSPRASMISEYSIYQ